MLETIIDIISRYTDYDRAKMNRGTSLVMDIDLNSLEMMKALLDLEEEFEVEIPEEAVLSITTIGEVEDLIKELKEEE